MYFSPQFRAGAESFYVENLAIGNDAGFTFSLDHIITMKTFDFSYHA